MRVGNIIMAAHKGLKIGQSDTTSQTAHSLQDLTLAQGHRCEW